MKDRLRPAPARPRLGFLGVGWIGLNRMTAITATGAADIVAIADPSEEMVARAADLAPEARLAGDLEELLAQELDGLVIATPSAFHAEQAMAALDRGVAVFCQKPLGRTEAEARAVVEAAQRADLLLGVDLSYRFTEGMRQVRQCVRSGELGRVFAADLVFHNAYGPDKPWFYDMGLSGGGCVMDLGVHLVDLALWTLDFPAIAAVESALFRQGTLLEPGSTEVEDCAFAKLTTADGRVVRLSCSWRLNAGQDAVIAADFFGTDGGAAFRNVGGSFFDFTAARHRGTSREMLAEPPDDWGGRGACDWLDRLAHGERFDPAAHRFIDVAHVLDRIYGRAGNPG